MYLWNVYNINTVLSWIAFSSEICLCFLSHINVLKMKRFVIMYLVLIPGELWLVFPSIKDKKSHFRTWVIFFFPSLCYKSKLHIIRFIVVNNHTSCCNIEVWLFLRFCKVYNCDVVWDYLDMIRDETISTKTDLTAQSVETSVTELTWRRERHKLESQYANHLKKNQ